MIDNIWRESGFEVLIVGGHHAEVPRFLDCLTHELRGRLADTFAVDDGARLGEVKREAAAIVDRYERAEEERMIADAVETSAAGGLAVLGLPQCLWTGSVAAVGDLLVQDGAVAPGVMRRGSVACPVRRYLPSVWAPGADTTRLASSLRNRRMRLAGRRAAKTLVRELHRAGVKVILDVVHNHSGEGNEMGPTLPFRGLDNPSYYSLTGPPEAPGYYMNYTGCGNSLRFESPAVIRLVMD